MLTIPAAASIANGECLGFWATVTASISSGLKGLSAISTGIAATLKAIGSELLELSDKWGKYSSSHASFPSVSNGISSSTSAVGTTFSVKTIPVSSAGVFSVFLNNCTVFGLDKTGWCMVKEWKA